MARIRSYKVESGGKTYRIYRGDMHRHTDISSDGVGDGSLMDLHRYGLDAAAFDFIIVSDHNMGGDNEYPWWRTQQANDLYTRAGRVHFDVRLRAQRAVSQRPSQRHLGGARPSHAAAAASRCPQPMDEDTAKLYDYLRRTGGICTSHTSATDQGTNWADRARSRPGAVRRAVPGLPHVLRSPGAPRAINDKTDRIHGQYKTDGFVSLALEKGYRLGFQSSSDHISTHVSYACILAEDFSRKGLVEAIEERHSYAATDNIVLDVRMGGDLMGDEVRTAKPRLDVVVLGTGKIDKVEILRNNEVVHTVRPDAEEARLSLARSRPASRRQRQLLLRARASAKRSNGLGSPIWVVR